MKNRHTILVVDDDPKVLELIEAMLIPAGYYVVTLGDSTKMIDIVQQMEPDLILLDIMMPIEDGYSILNKLKKGTDRSNIPIVMVSAVADDGHKVIASIDGASAYITKPIDRRILLETIAHFFPDSGTIWAGQGVTWEENGRLRERNRMVGGTGLEPVTSSV